MKPQISFAGALRLATLALLMPVASAFAVQSTDAASVSQVLQEVKVHAALANEDVDVLDSFARSNVSWKSHAILLNEIRGHVNDLLHDYSRLQKIAHKANPQQREAINRLEPMLREMTASLTDTIRILSENQKQVSMPSFRAQIHSDYVNINNVYRELCKCTDKNA